MAGNLFSKAKKIVKTPKAKDEKISVFVPGIFDKMSKYMELTTRMKEDKAEADILSDEIKESGSSEWVKLYESTGKNPGSIIIESKGKNGTSQSGMSGQCLFVPSDKYISVNTERVESLIEKYGEEVVTEANEYIIDATMVDKYGDVLSRLIMESDEISDDDKEKIIKSKTSYSITKGLIDDFTKYGDIAEVMADVRPIMSLKNVQIND